jgi:hypothetical protein
MDYPLKLGSENAERGEVEVLLTALARTPRLASLMGYLTKKYLEGKVAEITEYNIAIRVFRRSEASFDASRDSIARVEAHRLRKKLREYYATDGKDHSIYISLPAGSYIPVFTRNEKRSEAAPSPGSADSLQIVSHPTGEAEGAAAPEPAYIPARPRYRLPRVYAAVAFCVLAVLASVLIRSAVHKRSAISAYAPEPLPSVRSTVATLPSQIPLRILSGYDGTPKIDSTGAYWERDRYFHGGAAFQRMNTPITRTSDTMLFEYYRTTDFSYDIPLAPGPYELHLYFVASQWEGEYLETFHVRVNGQVLMDAFDISSDAQGINIADEKVFKDVYPASDGFLHLSFSSDRSAASVNAIEILPGLPHKQHPIRIVMQRSGVTDHEGNFWHPDTYMQNGRFSDMSHKVSGTQDPELYAQERYGHFSYVIPVDARGRYTLVLHFAELFFGSEAGGIGGKGSRVFRVLCNGTTLLDNFDIYKETGGLRAVTKSFTHLRPSPQGNLNLTFEPIINYATVSAIEVIDESE